jgi:heat shock protein HslJ
MRVLALAIGLAMTPLAAFPQDVAGQDWQIIAIDGKLVDMPATLQVTEGGHITGKAPCNGFSARNAGALPELKLQGIRSTKMACDRLAEEQVFFRALAAMEHLKLDGPKNLILTGPEGRSMEFILATVSSLPECKTCPPKE